jgi:hypothetical protein
MIIALQTSASHGNSGLSVWLSARPLARIGDLSYSWYLWHWPVLVFCATAFPARGVFATSVALVAPLALAEIAYRFIEIPIRHSKSLARREARTIVLALVVSGGVAAVGTGLKFEAAHNEVSPEQRAYAAARDDTPRVYKTECHANFDTTEMPACVFGHPDSKVTMVLFGDSHAAHWFPALEKLALEQRWRLISFTKSSCPSINVEVFNPAKRRLYFECTKWRDQMLSRIADMKPHLVVLSNSHRYNSDATWEADVMRTIQRFASHEIPVAIIRDIPIPGIHGPACLARMTWMKRNAEVECTFNRDGALARGLPVWQAERHAVSLYPHGLAIDMTEAIYPQNLCAVTRNSAVHFSDTNHLTASYAASLAPIIATRLREWADRVNSPIPKLIDK